MAAEREPVVRAGLKLLDELGLDGLTHFGDSTGRLDGLDLS